MQRLNLNVILEDISPLHFFYAIIACITLIRGMSTHFGT